MVNFSGALMTARILKKRYQNLYFGDRRITHGSIIYYLKAET